MLETLFAIGDFLPFLYIGICLVSVAHFQITTSLSIATIILCVSEFAHAIIRDLVWNNLSFLDPDTARIAWTGLWFSLNFVTAWIIYRVHVWRNVAISTDTMVVIWSRIIHNILLSLRYLSAITIKSEFVATLYQYAIPAINIGLGIYLIIALIRNIYDIRIQARVRRLPL